VRSSESVASLAAGHPAGMRKCAALKVLYLALQNISAKWDLVQQ
jgi:hypothetical protein